MIASICFVKKKYVLLKKQIIASLILVCILSFLSGSFAKNFRILGEKGLWSFTLLEEVSYCRNCR
jgi:hypothetical protein